MIVIAAVAFILWSWIVWEFAYLRGHIDGSDQATAAFREKLGRKGMH